MKNMKWLNYLFDFFDLFIFFDLLSNLQIYLYIIHESSISKSTTISNKTSIIFKKTQSITR